MTDYETNPDVCPSSLGEDGYPIDPSETAHVWDESSDPHKCAECGAEREQVRCICECGNEHTKYQD